MTLPNAEKAIVDERKVREYLLSPSHPAGRFKARFFGSIGFPAEAWSGFVNALQRLAAEGEAQVLEDHEYRQKHAAPKTYRKAKRHVDVSVGESVRIVRELQKRSQNGLSELTGIPQSTLSAIENDRVNLGVERANVLARAPSCTLPCWSFRGGSLAISRRPNNRIQLTDVPCHGPQLTRELGGHFAGVM